LLGYFDFKGIGDFLNPANIFVKKTADNKIKIYFTDLLIGVKIHTY
jgi:hypothetical protein